jgi:hypothetical protein
VSAPDVAATQKVKRKMSQGSRLHCTRWKTSVGIEGCAGSCQHAKTCADLRRFIDEHENPDFLAELVGEDTSSYFDARYPDGFPKSKPKPTEEVAMGDGQSHGAAENSDAAPRRVDATPKPAVAATGKPAERKQIKNEMVTFVETAPNSGLFEIATVSMADLVLITRTNRRVIAATEATEF